MQFLLTSKAEVEYKPLSILNSPILYQQKLHLHTSKSLDGHINLLTRLFVKKPTHSAFV